MPIGMLAIPIYQEYRCGIQYRSVYWYDFFSNLRCTVTFRHTETNNMATSSILFHLIVLDELNMADIPSKQLYNHKHNLSFL